MVDSNAVYISSQLVRKYGRNPYQIADELGITIMERSDFIRQKGAFKVILGNPFIFINGNLSDQMKKIVCAHELGHAMLHRKLGAKGITVMEFELFDIKSTTEYEANIFAAALLLDDEEVIERLRCGEDLVQVARALDTNVNLLLLKLHTMRESLGYTLPTLPRRDFLGSISDDAGEL